MDWLDLSIRREEREREIYICILADGGREDEEKAMEDRR